MTTPNFSNHNNPEGETNSVSDTYSDAIAIHDDEELTMDDIVASVLTGNGTFVGGDPETDALLYGMRRAFRAGLLYGTSFVDEATDSDELDSAFETFILAEVVQSSLFSE